MKKLRGFSLITIFLLTILFIPKYIHGASLNRLTTRTYELKDEFVSVIETRRYIINNENVFIPFGSEDTFTIFNPVQDLTGKEDKIRKTKDSIKVTDDRGFNIPYTSNDTDQGNINIKVRLPTLVMSSAPYSLVISYNSYGLLKRSGKLVDIYIPSFSRDYKFQDEQTNEEVITKVLIPKKEGEINFISPTNFRSEDNSNYIVSYSKEDLVGQIGWIQVGTEQNYSFSIIQPYKKSSDIDFVSNRYTILIPKEITSGPILQTIYIQSISHTPSGRIIDANGNIFLTFDIPANEDGEIRIEGYAILKQDNSFNFKDSGNISEIPRKIIEENTSPSEFWESNSDEIISVANSLKNSVSGEDKNIYELISAAYRFVIEKIDYSEVKRFGINERQGALATLKGGAAVCMEYSDLFIAIMRAMGVPTRSAFGYGYSALEADNSTDTINHQWAEVYIPKQDVWISVDTTWGESGKEIIGGDLNHFFTHSSKNSPEEVSTTQVQFIGDLQEVPKKTMSVFATADIKTETLEEIKSYIGKLNNPIEKTGIESFIEKLRITFFEIDRSITNLINSIFPEISNLGISVLKILPIAFITLLSIIVLIKGIRKKIKSDG